VRPSTVILNLVTSCPSSLRAFVMHHRLVCGHGAPTDALVPSSEMNSPVNRTFVALYHHLIVVDAGSA
jgi:hypothetical protein